MIRKIYGILVLCFVPLVSVAQEDVVGDDFDETSRVIRENPVIDWSEEEFDITVPSFIKSKSNRINFNGADWSGLRKALSSTAISGSASIVHIGDSHLQSGHVASEVRNNLQFDYGNAGRGLIVPLKMTKTNQPADYEFSSTESWSAIKLMSHRWPRTMGFTGTSISPANRKSSFLVATSEKEDYNPFSAITVFHGGQFFVTSITDENGNLVPFLSMPSKDYTHVTLTKDVTSAKIHFESSGDLTIYGASLSGDRPGVFFHSIGNNGASFSTYNKIGTVGEGITPLRPNLVIISLGTNEAFGKESKRAIQSAIDFLVRNIRSANPDAVIMLVTPMECQRVQYSKVKSKKRRGKSSYRSSRGYVINSEIANVRDAIIDYGKEHQIAVYDWYAVAGGENASNKWIDGGYFSRDRIHLSYKGYRLQGFLLYQALTEAFNNFQ